MIGVMTNRHPSGSAARAVRVAIVGSGPSGFFAAGHLLGNRDIRFEVDVFDRLPAPYGLLRSGVAPDHQTIKRIDKVYKKTAAKEGFRFFGNTKVGADIPVATLAKHYDQVIYAVGSEDSRSLNIPGIDLNGSDSATAFVGWYNAHPDFVDRTYDLEQTTSVVVVGVGNVSMDVARILAQDPEELASTDISEEALAVLRKSAVRDIVVLGRRGLAQAAFTHQEIKELAHQSNADLVVIPEEVALDERSEAYLESNPDTSVQKNIDIVHEQIPKGEGDKARKIRLRLRVSPVEVHGEDGSVTGVTIEHNELVLDEAGNLRPRGTGKRERIASQLMLRAVGYRGIPIEGLPFDERTGIITNRDGRVCMPDDSETLMPNTYVVGWAKRGPTGLVGTNRGDARHTVDAMIADLDGRILSDDPAKTPEAAAEMVFQHQPDAVTYEDWQYLDEIELKRGESMGKIRDKFLRVDDMLQALKDRD